MSAVRPYVPASHLQNEPLAGQFRRVCQSYNTGHDYKIVRDGIRGYRVPLMPQLITSATDTRRR